jgi:hypothetical protein
LRSSSFASARSVEKRVATSVTGTRRSSRLPGAAFDALSVPTSLAPSGLAFTLMSSAVRGHAASTFERSTGPAVPRTDSSQGVENGATTASPLPVTSATFTVKSPSTRLMSPRSSTARPTGYSGCGRLTDTMPSRENGRRVSISPSSAMPPHGSSTRSWCSSCTHTPPE